MIKDSLMVKEIPMDVIKFAIPYEEGLIVIKRIKGNDENKEELEYVMLL